MAAKHPIVKEVRGAGLMWGLELHARRGGRSCPRRSTRGVIVNRTAETVVRLLPPLVITRSRGRRSARPARCGARRPWEQVNETDPTRRGSRCGRRTRRRRQKLHALIQANLEEGHLLPRTLDELTVHAGRFVVAVQRPQIVGCAELAPLSPHVAEVRSLAVDGKARGSGVGVDARRRAAARARREGFEKLCAFTHAPGYFMHMGFSIVPHLWLHGEDLHRLREVPAVPAVRPVRDGRAARLGVRRRPRRRRRSRRGHA